MLLGFLFGVFSTILLIVALLFVISNKYVKLIKIKKEDIHSMLDKERNKIHDLLKDDELRDDLKEMINKVDKKDKE